MADGAKDNWTFLEGELSKGDCVLDFYHAAEHLHQALEFIYGVGSAHVNKHHKKYRGILRDDPQGITKVIKHLKYKAKQTDRLRYCRVRLQNCSSTTMQASWTALGA